MIIFIDLNNITIIIIIINQKYEENNIEKEISRQKQIHKQINTFSYVYKILDNILKMY